MSRFGVSTHVGPLGLRDRRFYWGSKLMLITTPDGMVTGFGLVNPKLYGEREAVVLMLAEAKNRPAPGTIGRVNDP